MHRPRRSSVQDAVPPPDAPGYPGELGMLLGTAPVFRKAFRGFDRMQVENYVAWVESEMLVQRRTADDLVRRFREYAAELEQSSKRRAASPEGQQLLDVSEQAGRLLASAADEATHLVAAGMAEADRVVTDAHQKAGHQLQRIRDVRTQVAEWCSAQRREVEAERNRLLTQARAEADALLAEARRQRAEEDRAAEQERARLAEEAAARVAQEMDRARREREAEAASTAARLAQTGQELDGLQQRKSEVLGFLRTLDGLMTQALTQLDAGGGNGVRGPSERIRELPRSA